MMRSLTAVLAILVAAIAVVACATLGELRSENRQNLQRLEEGMTRAQVHEVMGRWEKRTQSRTYVTNPYRTERLPTLGGGTASLLWYYTSLKARDGAITDDELTPVVLRADTVVGWGWSMLTERGDSYTVRIR
jgi:hypothetical protein